MLENNQYEEKVSRNGSCMFCSNSNTIHINE